MTYEIQWALTVIGAATATGALLGLIAAILRELTRG